jgi:flagellar protein FliL
MASPPDKNASSPITTIAAVLGLTVVVAIAGAFLGTKLAALSEAKKPAEASAPAEPTQGDATHGAPAAHEQEQAPKPNAHKAGKSVLKELAPIVTNLADSNATWIRLQVVVVYDPDAAPHPEIMFTELTADIVAYLRTISLRSIEGGAGLRRLNEELSERATIRSEGAVQELVIQSLVVQ